MSVDVVVANLTQFKDLLAQAEGDSAQAKKFRATAQYIGTTIDYMRQTGESSGINPLDIDIDISDSRKKQYAVTVNHRAGTDIFTLRKYRSKYY